MKMKTSELTGQALNWAVAKCEFPEPDLAPITWLCYITEGVCDRGWVFKPSADWSQAGPIIEREKIGVWWATHYVDDDGVEYGNHWYSEPACTDDNADKPYRVAVGPTSLIAAMRCYVVNKLGDEVEVPDEVVS